MDYELTDLKILVEQNGGIVSAKQLEKAQISRLKRYAYLAQEILRKEGHGIYSLADNQPDEYLLIQCRSKKMIFSHATAAYLHEMSDRTPHVMDITVPQGDNVSRIKRDYANTRFHYCKKEFWDLGLEKTVTPQGFSVNIYDRERCICDLIRDRKNVDSQVFNQALREYFRRLENPRKILKYAKELRVEEKVRMYMEVMTA